MYGLIFVIVIIALYYIVNKFFPGIFPESWKMRSGKDMYKFMFRLNEGENIIHQSVGISDPNSHLTKEEVQSKNRALMLQGKRIRESSIIHIAITDQNRLILNYRPNERPVSFDKEHLPQIIDTGRSTKRADWIDVKYIKNFPEYSGDTRIIEIDSPLIPDILFHSNTGKFEMSLAVEFIPVLMAWKKNQLPRSN
jgi:hypothetical protein